MAKRLFSGDFLLRQYRDAKTEVISEQAVYERIDQLLQEKLDKLETIVGQFEQKYTKLLEENKNYYDTIKHDISTMLENKLEGYTTVKIPELIGTLIDSKLTQYPTVDEIKQQIASQVSQLTPACQTAASQNNDAMLANFELEYQEFIRKQKEKLALKNELLTLIKNELPSLVDECLKQR